MRYGKNQLQKIKEILESNNVFVEFKEFNINNQINIPVLIIHSRKPNYHEDLILCGCELPHPTRSS